MNNNVQVNLQFTANTAQAKQELANLQTQLTSLINQPVPVGAKMTADIQKATAAAAELKVHLQNATNVKTGMLDFGKLNQSIKQSGMSLSQYGAQLQALGPQGQQAFMQLANSVAAAEVPIRRASGALTGMMTTFKNTVKWMASSTVLNGLVRTMSSAYGYAQNLNESLNNIRIVTGQNIDQMARFAKEANKAAKALSATTTEYTNASLIYYQQGLSDQQVKERTDVTIKMANVSRQSAEVVSDQMTAVWNNFYDGTKSIESYADAMTALGAATASSTDEIAQGLEKFAAIADTVGLSYEYATAALATVTAQTRQSADVVGTAFKTLFARIQDLKLGETLEDGTTMGQYSEALAKVGINIKATNGELKDMDDILNEMGAKWQTLDKDQQVALAKSVAGLRQYTQLIALMDNWDFMEKNLEVVENSSGALQKQADIYAESWEAASKRVKASAEEVYSKLLNDKFFIELNNGLADFIGFLGKAIDGLGGVKGLLLMLGTIATKVFSTQIAQGLRNMAYNMQMMTKSGQQAVQANKQKEMEAIQSQMTHYSTSGLSDRTAQQGYTQQLEAQVKIIENAEHLSATEKTIAQTLLDQANSMSKQAVEQAKLVEQERARRSTANVGARATMGYAGLNSDEINARITNLSNASVEISNIQQPLETIRALFKGTDTDTKKVKAAIEELKAVVGSNPEWKQYIADLEGADHKSDELVMALDNAGAHLDVLGKRAIDSALDFSKLDGTLELSETQLNELRSAMENYLGSSIRVTVEEGKLKIANDNVTQSYNNVKQAIDAAKGAQLDWATVVTNTASTLMNIGMVMMQVSSLMDTLNNPDTSGWQKFTTILMTLGMIVPSLLMVFKSFSSVLKLETVAKIANAAATMGQVVAEKRLNREKGISNKSTRRSIKQTWQDTKDTWNKSAMQKNSKYTQDARGVWHQKGKKGSMSKAEVGAAEKLAGKEALTGLGLNVAAFAVVAASIAAAGFIIKGAMDSYNEDANKAKEAAELAQKAQENYDKQKESYNTFKASADEYNSAIEGLEKLTKGTVEYEEAVQKANEQALKLLETNKNLSYEYNSETGLIEIDKASLAEAQRAQLKQMKSAQDASIVANMESDAAALRYKQTNLGRNKLKSKANADNDDGAWLGGGLGGGAALAAGGGAAVGLVAAGAANFWNPVGWALIIAGAVTAAIGTAGALGNDAEEAEYEALEKLTNSYATLGEAAFEDKNIEALNLNDDKLIKSLKSNRSEVAKLVKEMYNNTIETKKNTEAIIGDVAGDQAGMLSGYQQEQMDYYGKIYGEMIDNINRTEDYGSNDDITKFIDTYDKIMGSDFAKKLQVGTDDVQMTDQGLAVVWMENGEQQKKLLTEMANEAKLQSAKVATGNKSQEVEQTLLNSNISNNLLDIIKLAATGEGKFASQLSQNQIQEMQNKGIISEHGINREELIKFLENAQNISVEEMAKRAGLVDGENKGNVDAYLARYEELIKAEELFKDLYQHSADEVANYYQLLMSNEQTKKVFDQASGEVQIQFRDFLSETFRVSGQQGLDIFNDILNDLPETELDEFINNLGSIDWETATPDSIIQLFKNWGIETDISAAKLQNFINIMKEGQVGIQNLANQTKELIDITKEIKPGDTITEEQYNTIKSAELGLEKYFTLMYDGTYQLINAAIDFQEVFQNTFVQKAEKNLDSLFNNINELQSEVKATETKFGKQAYDEEYQNLKFNENYSYWFEDGKMGSYDVASQDQGWIDFWALKDAEYRAFYKNDVSQYFDRNILNELGKKQGFTDAEIANSGVRFTNSGELEMYAATTVNGSSTTKTKKIANVDEAASMFIDKKYGDLWNKDNPEEMQKKLQEMWDFSSLMGFDKRLEETFNSEKLNLEEFLKDRDGNLTKLIEIYKDAGDLYANSESIINSQLNEISATYQAIASTATTMEELDDMYETYGEGFKHAYEFQAQAIDQAREYQDFNVEEVREYAEHLQEIAYDTDMVSNELFDNEEAAQKTAIATMRLNKGVQALSESFEDWNEILQNSDEGSQEYYEALSSLRTAMADLLGISEKSLRKAFLIDTKNLQLMQKAAEGSAEAIDELAFLAAKDYILNIEGIDGELETSIDSFMDKWKDYVMEIRVGASIDSTEFENELESMLNSTKLTQAQFEEFLNAWQLEYEGTFDKKETIPVTEVQTQGSLPVTTTYTKDLGFGPFLNGATSAVETWSEVTGYKHAQAELQYIGNIDVKKIRKSTSGAMSNYSPKNPGGSKSSTPDKKKKTDVVDRYKEVNDQIDNVSRAYDNASKAADRLYGKARLNQMKEMNKILANEVDLLAEKRKEAEDYLQTDQADLNTIAQENIGLQFDFEPNTGDITNYQEVMDAVWKDYDAYYESAKSGGFSEEEQERLDDYDKAINNTKEAIAQYDETRELLEDIDDEIQAKLYEMQDKNYEAFTYQIDIELEIRDLKLDFNQYKVDKVMTDLLEAGASGKFKDLMNNRLGLLEEANNADNLDWLQSQFALGEDNMAKVKSGELKLEDIDPEQMGISQEAYAEGLKTEYSNTMDNINALKDYDELMQSYYGDTLAAANEEIEKYTSLMEHGAGVLEHYKNLMKLTGKETDYKQLGKILEGEAQVAADTLAVSTAIYEDRISEAETAWETYQNALTSGASQETLDTLKETWLTAQNAANEAQNQMLADTEAWAETQKAILENSLADLGKSLEKAISGRFGSYNELSSAIERAEASTEEWLTATNKVYETNKLINQAQKEIDNTSNTVAKRKMQNYIKETEQLQKRSKLSNFELEIQQAKYELLLAEIALEEAQNAKSTVRLQRDSSGNFGYVYTADQNAIDDAQQKYQDAENNLYNIRLEGANNYTQKSLELQMQWADTMQELNERRLNGEFETEEAYNQAVLAARDYFYKQLDDYSYLYSVAISEDTRVAADAWSTEFSSMVTDTKNWKTNVSTYISEVQGAFSAWDTSMSSLYGENGTLSQIETKVNDIKNAASALKTLLIGDTETGTKGIVDDAATASTNALDLATNYASVRNTIVGEGGLIEAYEKQLGEIITLIDNLSNLDNTSINVNQTQTYQTKLDASAFHAAVRDFSAAVGGISKGSYIQGSATGSQVNQFFDYGGDRGISVTSYGYVDNNELRGAKVIDEQIKNGIKFLTIETLSGKSYIVKESDISYYDTGGYTGEWGPDGKLAVLHEKELILKPDDTSNFLAALGILDNILVTLDKYSVNAQLSGLLSSPAFSMNTQEALEQNVHIEASFPGVQDRNEIEEAFNTLINQASQYVNRK